MIKLIISTVGFVGAIALLVVYIQPTYAQINVLKAQIAEYDSALAKAGQLDARMKELGDKYSKLNKADISRLAKMLPDHDDNIGLILEFDAIASRYGLALTNVDVSTGDARSAQTPDEIQGVVGTAAQYATITLHFSTFGTYDNFRSFLHDLEQSLRLVDVVSLNVTPSSVATGGQQTFTYDATVRTYWLK